MRVHLDLVGGLSGDMFIAGLLNALPHMEPKLRADIALCPATSTVHLHLDPHNDGVIQGCRFRVHKNGSPAEDETEGHHHVGDHAHHHHSQDPGHAHHDWRTIRTMLESCGLEADVRHHAVAIFGLLAEAEGRVHGCRTEDVTFHEVGAWDSIADIVGAASLIAGLAGADWTASAVPLGSGRVRTAHGMMPVPAPATAVLLEGFPVLDDGVPGERVTPTGAALLRYLCAPSTAPRPRPPARLAASGVGFGSRVLPNLSNCVRVLLFDEATPSPFVEDLVAQIEFEVDDQTAEDLGQALLNIRAIEGVLDALQTTALGKKNRMVTAIRILAAPQALDTVIGACFAETTTIGLRHSMQRRTILHRHEVMVSMDGRDLGVKVVQRDGARSVKVEADALAQIEGHAERQRVRAAVEALALKGASS